VRAIKNYVPSISFIVIPLVLLFLNLQIRPLFGVEGRWAEAAREIYLRKSWFVPTINFEPHLTKPLLPFWLIKISRLIDDWGMAVKSCEVIILKGESLPEKAEEGELFCKKGRGERKFYCVFVKLN